MSKAFSGQARKSCPFCGCSKIYTVENGEDICSNTYYVEVICENCSSRTRGASLEIASKRWNNRHKEKKDG